MLQLDYRAIARQKPEVKRSVALDILENLEESASNMFRFAGTSQGMNLRAGALRPTDAFSIRNCFTAFVKEGEEILRLIDPRRKSGGFSIRDVYEAAGDTINSGDFANITGQFIWNRFLEGYNYPMALWPMLTQEYQTNFLNGERIPGVGEFGTAGIEVVGEGERFPTMGLNEEWIDTPPLQKRGFTCEITKEMTIQDQTSLVMERAAGGGKWISINKDIRCLQHVTGVVNTYSRNGVSSNNYQTAGSYINKTAVPLVNWQSVQTVELLLANITDPNTGTPVVLEATQFLVPLALKRTSNFLMQAGSVAMVDNTPTNNTVRSYGDNPMAQGYWGQKRADVMCNSFVGNTAVIGGTKNNTTSWWLGDFKRAYKYKQAWAAETTQMAPNSLESFHRDVVTGWKFTEMGTPMTENPRYAAQGN